VGCAQAEFVSHWTHPSVGLHVWLPRHWSFPLTPQSALPGASPLPLAPLQAMSTATTAVASKPQDVFALLMVQRNCSTFLAGLNQSVVDSSPIR
jgi:hypothetical protein